MWAEALDTVATGVCSVVGAATDFTAVKSSDSRKARLSQPSASTSVSSSGDGR